MSTTNRRTIQARETRRLIVDAARRLFTTQGYGGTSIAQIARQAGVAVPTVYASAGTKSTLLRLLLDRIDEEAGIEELAAELAMTANAKRVVALEVRITRQLAERCGDIIAALQSAAGVEPEMAQALADGMERHRAGAQATVRRVAGLGKLRSGLAEDDASAIVATLCSPTVYAALTQQHGWSFDRCETWLNETLCRQLLGSSRTAA